MALDNSSASSLVVRGLCEWKLKGKGRQGKGEGGIGREGKAEDWRGREGKEGEGRERKGKGGRGREDREG